MRFPKTEHFRQRNIRRMKAAGTYSKHPSPLPTEVKFHPAGELRRLLRDFRVVCNALARKNKMAQAKIKMEEDLCWTQDRRLERCTKIA